MNQSDSSNTDLSGGIASSTTAQPGNATRGMYKPLKQSAQGVTDADESTALAANRKGQNGGGQRHYTDLPVDDTDGDIDDDGVQDEDDAPWEDEGTSKGKKFILLTVFLILGAAVLLPFNTLVTPTEYYRHLFSHKEGGSESFLSWVLVVYNGSTIAFGAHATLSMNKTTPSRRIYLSMSVILISLALLVTSASQLPSFSKMQTVGWFYGLLTGTFVIAASSAYLQNAVTALCSIFGGQAMGLMLAGQGAVGVVISLVQLGAAYNNVAKSSLSYEEEDGGDEPSVGGGGVAATRTATMLFTFAACFTVFSVFAFAWLARTPEYKKTVRAYDNARGRGDDSAGGRQESQSRQSGRSQRPPSPDGSLISTAIQQVVPEENQHGAYEILAVQRKILSLTLSLFALFSVTLAVYPAVTARVTSTNPNGSMPSLVFVAFHLVCFNSADLLGRTLPSISSERFVIRSRKVIVGITAARILLVPLFLACNVRSANGESGGGIQGITLPDWIFFLLVSIFGLTNGLLATTIFVVGSTDGEDNDLKNEEERANAGAILSFWLTTGLAAGSVLSFAVGAAV